MKSPPSASGDVAAYRVGSAPIASLWARNRLLSIPIGLRTIPKMPSPGPLVCRLVAAYPGWQATAIAFAPAARRRRSSSNVNSRFSSFERP